MFQSFTEGELQHVVGTLLDRKRRKSRRQGDSQARRTKRARRPKPCSLRELEMTVSELGLGYDSDETVLLRYCSGKCLAHRHNYDITMEHMMRTGFRKKGRKDKVSNGPCCRPTAFENDFSFLDNNSRYHTIQNVSARNCGCVWPPRNGRVVSSCCSRPRVDEFNRDAAKRQTQKSLEYKLTWGGKEGNMDLPAARRPCLTEGLLASVITTRDRITPETFVWIPMQKNKQDRTWLFLKVFYHLFYLCSNTVNCVWQQLYLW